MQDEPRPMTTTTVPLPPPPATDERVPVVVWGRFLCLATGLAQPAQWPSALRAAEAMGFLIPPGYPRRIIEVSAQSATVRTFQILLGDRFWYVDPYTLVECAADGVQKIPKA